jgi:hypothetical protein
VRYLAVTGQSGISVGLEEFSLYYCTRMSFREVEGLVHRHTGSRLVCEQTLWNWVQQRVKTLDGHLRTKVEGAQNLPFPVLSPCVDLYDKDAAEVIVLMDAIGVKAQKPKRDKPGEPTTSKETKRHDLDLMVLQGGDGQFTYLSGSADQTIPLTQVADAQLRQEWGDRQTPLPLVGISDGARCIRTDLDTICGRRIPLILDWYHLEKQVYQRLSMCASGRSQRQEWERTVLGHLWHGRVCEAISFLRSLPTRNPTVLTELSGYLEKHQEEIIDYDRRRACGKPIGSGRVEKGVDLAVGLRQKDNGMSWSKRGSHALAQLEIAQLNGLWTQVFDGLSLAA